MSDISEWTSAPGYEKSPKDGWRSRILFVAYHHKRTLVLSCLSETDGSGLSFPENERSFRPFELFVLGCDVLWCDVLAKLQRATNGFYTRLYRRILGCRSHQEKPLF